MVELLKNLKEELGNTVNDDRISCRECGIWFAPPDKSNVCPKCQERNYFNCVREYIDDEKPTVDELSRELRIPKVKIYRWIEDGRVQYIPGTGITGLYCERCGKAITSGALCIDCAKEQYKQRNKKMTAIGMSIFDSNDGKMRTTLR